MMRAGTSELTKIPFMAAAVLWALLVSTGSLWAGGEERFPEPDETELMFVGEDVEILSIASRREESAWQAPAVAQVDLVTRLISDDAKIPWQLCLCAGIGKMTAPSIRSGV